MGHCINAIIGNESTLARLIALFGLPHPKKLDFDLVLIGLDELRLDILATDESASFEGFTYMTAKIAKELEANLNHGRALYIETQYFGGIGEQCAALFEDGNLIWKASTFTVKSPINEGLEKLGVTNLNEQDAFDRIGLSHFRSFSSLGFYED